MHTIGRELTSITTAPAAAAEPIDASELEHEFQSVEDGLKRIRLPSYLHLSKGRSSNLQNEEKHTAGILSKSARYSEALLKILSQRDIYKHYNRTRSTRYL